MKQQGSTAPRLPWMLELVALWGFAVAQPIYALLGEHPAFITAHGMTYPVALGLTAVLSIGIPVLIGLFLIVLRAWRPTVAAHSFRLITAILLLAFAAPIAWRVELQPVWQVVCLLGLTGACAWLVFGTRAGAPLLRVLAACGIVFPAFFLLSTPVANALGGQLARVPFTGDKTPNIVILVFDELPTHALTAGQGQVNRRLWPNFARLADKSTWYRNASADSTSTEHALPSLVTGMRPAPQLTQGGPDAATFPKNLFALLADGYQLIASEPVTGMCPAPDCVRTNASTQSAGTLALDLLVVYLHAVTPPGLRGELPDINQQWSGFAFGRLAERAASGLGLTRHIQVRNMLQAIRERSQPALYFLHVTLPHAPYHYAPSGYLVLRHEALRAIDASSGSDLLSTDPVAIAELRRLYLWQLGYVDKIVGDVMQKLADIDALDSSLLVVTADHGVSLSPGSKRRRLDADNVADIISIPLFVKLPGQTAGAVVDRNVALVDLVPTIMAELGMAMPWDVDGEPLERAARGHKLVADAGKAYEFPPDAALPTETVRRRWAWLANASYDEVSDDWSFAPDTPVAAEHAVTLDNARVFQNVVPEVFVPLIVRGTLIGPPLAEMELAIAVNGRAAVRAMRYTQADAHRFVAFLPPDALERGPNQIDVLGRLTDRSTLRLLPANEPLQETQ